MKTLTVYYKNIIIFALLFVTIHSAAASIEWKVVVREGRMTQRLKVFKATAHHQQNGQNFYYFKLFATGQEGYSGLSRFGISANGCPIPAHGQNLVTILADAMVQQGSANSPLAVHFNQMREAVVHVGSFPLHWLSQQGECPNGLVLDRIHYINENIVYVNLQPDRGSSDPEGNQDGNVEVGDGVTNAGFENEEQRDHSVAVQGGAARAETRSGSVIGVILQRYTSEELRQQQLQDELRFEYRLIVIHQRLDDETVSAVLNNTATDAGERRVHFETYLNSEALLSLSQFTQSQQNQQMLNVQPEASPEERSYFRIYLQYVLTHCLCCCMASGVYRANPR